jgi:hypothetical protein
MGEALITVAAFSPLCCLVIGDSATLGIVEPNLVVLAAEQVLAPVEAPTACYAR